MIISLVGAVLAILLITLIYTVHTFFVYRAAYSRVPRRYGLAPIHVMLVALGTFIIQGTLAWSLVEGFFNSDQGVAPFTIVRLSLYGLGSFIVLTSLFVVKNLQKKRMKHVNEVE